MGTITRSFANLITASGPSSVSALTTLTANNIQFPSTQVSSANANNLDDYEEGTFTPTVTSGTGSITTVTGQSGTYTKIGRQVTVTATALIVNNGTGGSYVQYTIPFTANASFNFQASARENNTTGNQLQAQIVSGQNSIQFYTSTNGYPGGTNYQLQTTITYQT
jgi:hypothetical protein